MSRLPRSHFLRPSLIEKASEVSFAHLLAGLRGKQIPQGLILIEDLQVALLAGGCNFVSTEQKAIRETIDYVRSDLCSFRARDNILGHFVPRDVEIDILERGIAEDDRKISCVILYRSNDTSHARMCPDDCRIRMPLQKGFHLFQVRRRRALLRERNIHVIVEDND